MLRKRALSVLSVLMAIALTAISVSLILATGSSIGNVSPYDLPQTIAAAISAVTGTFTLVAATVAAMYAKSAVDEARRSGDIAHRMYIADQRAWISVDLRIVEPITFCNSSVSLGVLLHIENIGKTPALNVSTNMDLRIWENDNIAAVREIAESSKKIVPEYSKILAPGRSYERGWRPSATYNEERSSLYLVVFGVVTYQTIPEQTVHQTGFCYLIDQKSGDGKLDSWPIEIKKSIDPDDIQVEAIDGGFAD